MAFNELNCERFERSFSSPIIEILESRFTGQYDERFRGCCKVNPLSLSVRGRRNLRHDGRSIVDREDGRASVRA